MARKKTGQSGFRVGRIVYAKRNFVGLVHPLAKNPNMATCAIQENAIGVITKATKKKGSPLVHVTKFGDTLVECLPHEDIELF